MWPQTGQATLLMTSKSRTARFGVTSHSLFNGVDQSSVACFRAVCPEIAPSYTACWLHCCQDARSGYWTAGSISLWEKCQLPVWPTYYRDCSLAYVHPNITQWRLQLSVMPFILLFLFALILGTSSEIIQQQHVGKYDFYQLIVTWQGNICCYRCRMVDCYYSIRKVAYFQTWNNSWEYSPWALDMPVKDDLCYGKKPYESMYTCNVICFKINCLSLSSLIKLCVFENKPVYHKQLRLSIGTMFYWFWIKVKFKFPILFETFVGDASIS